MNIPNIEKTIKEQFHKELQVIKENRKREPVSLWIWFRENNLWYSRLMILYWWNIQNIVIHNKWLEIVIKDHFQLNLCVKYLLISNKVLVIFKCIVYKGESLSLRSLLMKTAEKIDQNYWLNSGIILFWNLSIVYIYIFRTI